MCMWKRSYALALSREAVILLSVLAHSLLQHFSSHNLCSLSQDLNVINEVEKQARCFSVRLGIPPILLKVSFLNPMY